MQSQSTTVSDQPRNVSGAEQSRNVTGPDQSTSATHYEQRPTKRQKTSLVDDYANPNLEQPSYMDPED